MGKLILYLLENLLNLIEKNAQQKNHILIDLFIYLLVSIIEGEAEEILHSYCTLYWPQQQHCIRP